MNVDDIINFWFEELDQSQWPFPLISLIEG